MISIEADEESDLIRIKATTPTLSSAARIANVYAEEYIGFRRDAARRQDPRRPGS